MPAKKSVTGVAGVRRLIRQLDKQLDDLMLPDKPKLVKPRSSKRPGSK